MGADQGRMPMPAPGAPARSRAPAAEAAAPDRLDVALDGAIAYLRGLQEPEGEWCAELEGDSILESEYVLTWWVLGRRADHPRLARAAETLRRAQRPDGGWAIWPGGPAEVSASVKAYFVLKLMGDDPESEPMRRARRAILRLGGVEAANSYTKIYLAIFGQYDWHRCPAVPPELVLFPTWFPFNVYEMSAWSRAIVIPLSIIWAKKPRVPVPPYASIAELRAARPREPADVTKYTGRRTWWTRFFAAADVALKFVERSPLRPLRRRALAAAEGWVRDHLRRSDGVGAIFPPIINTIIAWHCLGYDLEDATLASQVDQLERLVIDDDDGFRVQPCFSALWDTAQVVNALLVGGTPPQDPAVLRAARWMLDREVREPGDWALKLPDVEPSGWYFEYANEHYPDCDDTAEVLTALAQVRFPDPREDERRRQAMDRALRWLLAMQNDDGGWAAFDRGCDREFLTHVPFADHNAMLDPSCEDITARVLETLDHLGVENDDPAVQRAIAYLTERQEEDGSWYGRWGCNYIYGTWLALWGLARVGLGPDDERIRRGADWLERVQNADGGWGELPGSYDDPATKGRGPSTAAQTSWAVIGLIAAGRGDGGAAQRGIEHLLATQEPDGGWHDEHWTGTGFPRVFYLRYHLYATQFPLLALALHRRRARTGTAGAAGASRGD